MTVHRAAPSPPLVGANALVFNTATMLRAEQHYMDTVLFREGHNLVATHIQYSGAAGTYDVRIEELKEGVVK